MAFIGIDIGTSAVKAILVGSAGDTLGEASVPLEIQVPQPGWVEQDPAAWWEATCTALAILRQRCGTAWTAVQAMGLSGQMHGAVLLDAADTVLRPAILWNDGRSAGECAELERRLPGLGALAGVPAMPGFTAPKLLWLRRHEPQISARAAHVLLPKDYVRLRLTGARATDMSDAAGTLWLDQRRRVWSDALLDASETPRSAMPALFEGTETTGTLLPAVAAELGLPNGVLVAAGAGDAAAGAVGIGATEDGDAFLSIGTSGQFLIAGDAYRPEPERFVHAFCHALPGRWHQMAALLNAGYCLQWFAGVAAGGDIGQLIAEAERDAPQPGAITFLPYLSGERTPLNDPQARGCFIGLGAGATRAEMTRAVLEGVALAFADAKEALFAAGATIHEAGVIGGATRSTFFMRILASAVGLPLLRYAGGETGPALGAARLAMIAAGAGTIKDVCRKPRVLDRILPDPALVAHYTARLVHFRALQHRLKGAYLA